MGRNRLPKDIRKDELITIRISFERKREMKKRNLSASKLFNNALDIKLKSVSEFDKPKKIRRLKL